MNRTFGTYGTSEETSAEAAAQAEAAKAEASKGSTKPNFVDTMSAITDFTSTAASATVALVDVFKRPSSSGASSTVVQPVPSYTPPPGYVAPSAQTTMTSSSAVGRRRRKAQGRPWLVYGLGLAVVATAGYFGWQAYQRRKR